MGSVCNGSSRFGKVSATMIYHAGRMGALALLLLAGCSGITPESPDVPPAPAGLSYPSVGALPAAPGGRVLTPDEQRRLEADLERYKAGPN
jgi:hypothetical protein